MPYSIFYGSILVHISYILYGPIYMIWISLYINIYFIYIYIYIYICIYMQYIYGTLWVRGDILKKPFFNCKNDI